MRDSRQLQKLKAVVVMSGKSEPMCRKSVREQHGEGTSMVLGFLLSPKHIKVLLESQVPQA